MHRVAEAERESQHRIRHVPQCVMATFQGILDTRGSRLADGSG
jgi:hypothetical protein